MKKLLTLLMTTLLCAGAWAGEVTIDLTAQGYNNSESVTTVTQDGITLTFAGGTNASSSPKYYTSGTSVRMYTGNTLTINAEDNITAIAITTDGNYTFANGSFDSGTMGDDKRSWTGSAKTVVYTCGNTQTRIQTITITTEAEQPAEFGIKVTPTPVEGQTFNAPVEVSIELLNATEDAMVTYKLGDGQETDYTEPFTLYKTTTVTVSAMNGDDDMTEAQWTGTYTIELPALAMNVTPAPGTYTEAQTVTAAVEGETYGDITWMWEFTLAGDTDAADEGEGATATVEESGTLYFYGIEASTGREVDGTFAYVIDPNYQPPVATNKYELVTSNDAIEVGANYIIITTEGDAAMGALNNSNKGTKATGYTLNEAGDIATLTDDTDVMVLKLDATNAGAYALAMPDGNFINITGSNTNIGSSASMTTLSIDVSEDAVAKIYGNSSRQILFQYGTANVFGNYANSNATNADYSTVALYKQVVETPQPVEYTITMDPAPGTYDGPQTVLVTVEPAIPEGAKIVYTYVEQTRANGPRKAEGDIAEMDYLDSGIEITTSGLLTIIVRDADGQELASTEGEYVINAHQTGIEALTAGKAVAGIRYYNIAGMASDKAYDGMNIVVVTYEDGTQAVAKVVR